MNKNEIAKIKRRLTADGRNPIEIKGIFVNGKKAVVSEISRSVMSLTQTEAEKYMQIFKRILSGDIGKNLSVLTFPQQEVMGGEFHERLMTLNRTALGDMDTLNTFLQGVIDNTALEGNYLILVMHDVLDTDFMGNNTDEGAIDNTVPANVFSYLLCAVCPVKPGKSVLSYDGSENDFVTKEPDLVVCAPDMGFMFPTYEDGGANISEALFYTKDIGEDHSDFIGCALAASEVAPILERKETFKNVLTDALAEECSYEVVQGVNEQIIEKLEEYKKDKEAEPLSITGSDLGGMLAECGVSDDRRETFIEKFEEEFGKGAALPAAGIVDDKQFEVKTPNVSVKVSPKQAGLIETRVIDGIKYILIPADEGVTVNGISIDI